MGNLITVTQPESQKERFVYNVLALQRSHKMVNLTYLYRPLVNTTEHLYVLSDEILQYKKQHVNTRSLVVNLTEAASYQTSMTYKRQVCRDELNLQPPTDKKLGLKDIKIT